MAATYEGLTPSARISSLGGEHTFDYPTLEARC